MNDNEHSNGYVRLQARVAEWAARNFGPNPPWRMACGIVEEVGEFHAATDEANRVDALADIATYSMNLCADRGWQYADFWDRATRMVPSPVLPVVCYAGALCRAVLKRDQGIRGYDQPEVFESALRQALQAITWYTVTWLQSMGPRPFGYSHVDHLGLVTPVIERVLTRDWTRHPGDAQLHEGVAP